MSVHSSESLHRVHGIDPRRHTFAASMRIFIRDVVAWRIERRKHLREYNELLSLPPHLLRDVGLCPDQIRSARAELRSAHWRAPMI